MEAKFQPTNETPLAALTIGQFKELIVTIVQPQQIIHSQKNHFPKHLVKTNVVS
jgi:hypothetical protein